MKHNHSHSGRVNLLIATVHAELPKEQFEKFKEVWSAQVRSQGKLIETFVTGALR